MKASQKRILYLLSLILVLATAWYLISPLFITIELNEDSPLIVNDNMDLMNESEKSEFISEVEKMKNDVTKLEEPMEGTIVLLKETIFEASAHEVKGVAKFIQTKNFITLRFEDFETINGPNLHVYLSPEPGINGAIDLGELKATSGNFNYELPVGLKLENYRYILIWCEPFGILFSFALF
jgi:hypothetical protein